MAVPPDFVGYTQGQAPGSYVFQRRGGPPLVLGGPTAERIAKELDASNPYAPAGAAPTRTPEPVTAEPNPYQGMAGSGSLFAPDSRAIAQAGGASAAPGAARGFDRFNGVGDGPATPAPQQAPVNASDAAGVARVQPPPQAPAAPTPPADGTIAGTKGGGRLIRGADGNVYVSSPGSAGKSKAQLERTADQGVVTPSRTETTIEGGHPIDPEYLAVQDVLNASERSLNKSIAVRQAQAAEQEVQDFAGEAAAAAQRAKLEADVASRAKAEAKRAEVEYDTAREEFRNSSVDPERLYRGDLGTFRKITHAIAMALSPWGSPGTQAMVNGNIQNAIDRDIAAQREDIKVRGASVDNALSNLTRKLGDQQAAEGVLRSAMLDRSARFAKYRAALTKRPEIIERAQQMDIAFQRKILEDRNAYLQAAQGKVVQKVLGEYAYPTQGSAPTTRLATLGELESIEGLTGKKLANEKTAQDVMNAEGGGDVDKQTRTEFATTSAVKGDIERVAAEHGFKVDPATGAITPSNPEAGFPSRGKGLIPGLPNNPDNERLRSDLVKIGRSVAGVLNPQGEPSPALVEANTPNAAAPDANIIAQLESAYRMALERERALAAGAKPQDLQTLERRKQDVTINQNQRSAPAAQPVQARPER